MVRCAVEHGDAGHRRRVGVSPRRLQPAAERHLVRPRRVGAVGAARRCSERGNGHDAPHLRQVSGEPVTRLLPESAVEDSSQRRVLRRPEPRPFLEVPVRDVRRHTDSRRPVLRRALRRAGDGARLVLAQHLRAIPARPLSRSRLGARRPRPRRVGSGDRLRHGCQCAGAVEYHSASGLRQELSAGAVRFAGVDGLSSAAAQADAMTPTLRADLHVHTCHSTPSAMRRRRAPHFLAHPCHSTQSGNLQFLGSRDCYSRPADVYRVAKARGMDLVAFTDHDSIGGALELLNGRPELASEVIVGEEVSCRLPDGGLQVHLAVYGMTEALHRDVQRLRADVFDVIARLREANVFFALNHLLHFYRGEIPLERYLRLLDAVPALEVRNGTMAEAHNRLLETIAARAPVAQAFRPAAGAAGSPEGLRYKDLDVGDRRFAVTAGSDAHTLRRIGTTWTE